MLSPPACRRIERADFMSDALWGKVYGYSDQAVMGQEAPLYISTYAGVGNKFFVDPMK